jgi:hypothetical protein
MTEQDSNFTGKAYEESGRASQTVIIQQGPVQPKNGIGTAGFVLALIALCFCWVPVLDWILWLLGLIFSFIGVFKQPKGLAIAGLAISLIVVIAIISIFGALFAALS